MFVGHALLAFALATLVADWRGWSARQALTLGLVAGAFAAIPDMDMIYTVVALDVGRLSADTLRQPSVFWDASRAVHRSITHSLLISLAAGPAFGAWAAGTSTSRGWLVVRAVASAILLSLVWAAWVYSGLAGTIVVGTFISGGTQAPNWARFASSTRVGFWAGLVAFLVGNGFLFLSGAVGGAVYDVTPAGDLYEVLAAQGLAAIGLIALVLNIWTTNDNAAYAFGVAGSEAFEFDRKRPFVLAGGTVGILLALAGAESLLIPWLSTLGQYVPPLGGVIIADFLLCWRLRIPHMDDVEFAGVRWIGILAYLVGIVVAALTAGQVVPGVAAPQVLPGPGGAALNGLVAAFVVHTAAYYLLEGTGVLAGHEISPGAERF